MAHKIQIKRGNKADIPVLNDGEMGLCIDTQEVFVGCNGTNIPVSTNKRTARFVVGTSTAGWTAADCDYLCDGTADDVEINAAITALPATGGEIVILDGTYNIVNSISITQNNVSLKGTIGTILKSQGNFHMINLNTVENCSIEGLTLDGNNKATSTSSRLVSLANTKKCNVSKNQLQNWEAFGIYASGGSDDVGYASITDNLISNVRIGISVARTNNLIANNRLYSGSGKGINMRLAINTLCIANVIEDYNIGILIESNSRSVTVTGNTIRNSETCGIMLTITKDNNITGNTIIKGDGTPGDYTEAQYSIRVYGGSTTNNNLISSNNCMGKAVTNEGGTGNTIIDNKWDATSDFEDLRTDVGDKTTLETTHKTTLVGAINEVFQTGNNVKSNTVDALLSVDSSLPITSSSAWQDIIDSIGNIKTAELAGYTWTQRTSSFDTTTIAGVGYGQGMFVAVGLSGKLATSIDGITWTQRTNSFDTTTIRGVCYDQGMFVAVGGNGKLATSTDGITWTQRTSNFSAMSTIYGVCYGQGMFVAVGNSGELATSTDGITWTRRTSSFGTTVITGVGYGQGMFVAVGLGGKLATSTDGITWTQRTSSFDTTNIQGVGYGQGMFVAVGISGKLATSTDGITWTQRTSNFGATDIAGVGYGQGMFVAVGNSGKLSTSANIH